MRSFKFMILFMAVFFLLPCEIKAETGLDNGSQYVLKETVRDTRVIPDKYNCGAKGTLINAGLGQNINGIQFGQSTTKNGGIIYDVNVLDFYKFNPDVTGTVVFENIDFSDYQITCYNEYQLDRDIHVVFKNCKFYKFLTVRGKGRVTYEFLQCSFTNFAGVNATFERCFFGGSYNDCLNPFSNITVSNCYFADLADTTGEGYHSDGVQIYGYKDFDVDNVTFTGCRFEIPAIEGANAINACIMLSMEFSNGRNLTFEDCFVNGGGYTIYAGVKYPRFNLENIKFTNVSVGCAHLFNDVYPDPHPNVLFTNLHDTNELYVSSVMDENGTTNLFVSNDTNYERRLVCYADGVKYVYVIPPCPTKREQLSDISLYPFDIKITIPRVRDYVVCYDQYKGSMTQIRYINRSGRDITVKDLTGLDTMTEDIELPVVSVRAPDAEDM